jgi:hypothetical protein
VPKHFFYLNIVEHGGGDSHLTGLPQVTHRDLGLVLNIREYKVKIIRIGTSLMSDSLSSPDKLVMSDSPDPLSRSGAWNWKVETETERKEETYIVVTARVRGIPGTWRIGEDQNQVERKYWYLGPGQPAAPVRKLVGEGQPGQGHAAVRQLHQGFTLTAQGSPEAINWVGKLAITEIVRLQHQTQALKGIHVVPD